MIQTAAMAIHVVVSVVLIVVILLQPGKAGDLGSMFGGGATESVFGASGAVPFLAKVTRVLAVLFIVTSLTMAYFSTQKIGSSVIQEPAPAEQGVTEPAPDDLTPLTPEEIGEVPSIGEEQSESEGKTEQESVPSE